MIRVALGQAEGWDTGRLVHQVLARCDAQLAGDITGYGVDAALFMMSARAFFRMRASRPGTLVDIVKDMNRHLTLDVSETGRFMTLFAMMFDPDKRRVCDVHAVHDPALLFDIEQDHFIELKGLIDRFHLCQHEGTARGTDPFCVEHILQDDL